jgi:uncharacterized protein (TIGR02118 family)
MITIFVTYTGDAATRFDRDYYVGVHLPLVLQAWGPYGLESANAFFPTSREAGAIAVAVCEFQNEAAMNTAFESSQTARVMADVKKFTDVEPRRWRAVPL